MVQKRKPLTSLRRKGQEELNPRPELLHMVRNLWLPTSYGTTPVAEVLVACGNMENLSMPSANLKHLTGAASGFPGLRHLMLTTPAFQYDWREADLRRNNSLRNLTHLFIVKLEERSCFVPVDDLPSLSHLAVPLITRTTLYQIFDFDVFDVPARFLQYEQLQMVIVHYREENIRRTMTRREAEGLVVDANAFNVRLYAMPFDNASEIKGLWKSAARGQDSVWKDAKVVLKHARHALVKS